ncbi:MAG: TAXI family TRAP transporter solute-binding subunit [Chloroflexi bacterium]|nr:TAXI family TRAP transporter solute-binding subunit [Chloroflexota bacterium]
MHWKTTILACLLVALALLALVLSGCTAAAPTPTPKPAAKPAAQPAAPAAKTGGQPVNMTLVGGSVGGLWSAITEGVAESIRRTAPAGSSITPKPGKDGPNSVSVAKGEAELAMAYNVTAFAAISGEEPYKEKMPNVRAIGTLAAQAPFVFIVSAKTPINSFEELKQKKYPLRMSPNLRGSTMEIAAKEVLAAYGITYQDIEKWGGTIVFQPTRESLDMMQDGKLDAHPGTHLKGASTIIEASMKMEMKVLPISQGVVDNINKKLGTISLPLEKGEFSFIKENSPSFTAAEMIITRAELPDDLAYLSAKGMGDNVTYLNTVHAILKTMTLQSLATTGEVPLHPAAARYYKEKGVLK